MDVRVTEVNPDKEKLILSVKSVLKDRQREEQNHKIAMIIPGTILDGVVESLQQYGAFVNIGDGLSGLVHISQICEKRITKPSEVLKMGQEVKVKVLKVEDGKISLTMKELDTPSYDKEDTLSAEGTEEPSSYSEEMTNTPFAALFSKMGL